MKILRRRRQILAENRAATEKQQRLGEYVDMQAAEARELSAWARDRLATNGLTRLFEATVTPTERRTT